MADSAFEIIQVELTKCAQSLLSFYTSIPEDEIVVQEARMPDCLEETMHCSSIGLAGDEFKLSIVILASSGTIAPMCPIPGASTADWIGELANQLVGRLKNALIEYGHSGQLSLPVTLSGSGLSLWNKTECPVTYFIHTKGGRVILRLEAEVNPDSVWELCDSPSAAAEGSMCLF